MARDEVDAVSLGDVFHRVALRATTDSGRPVDELGPWAVFVAVVEVLGGELRDAVLGVRRHAAHAGERGTEESPAA